MPTMLTAITRAVSPTLAKCELTCRDREPIDVGRASMEHANYLAILFELGIEVITIPADPELPDCVFVEDQAFVLDELAVITRSGARSRRAERDAIAQELSQLRPLQWIQKPGRIDGGDILRLGRRLFVGRSSRSDDEGLRQLAKIVHPLDYEVIDITPPWVADPETVLFCHGVATDRHIWAGWLSGLTDRYRIAWFDTRGFGRSHVPGAGFDWSMDLLADDILAVAEASSCGKFHLVGESLGGTVSLYLASRNPKAVKSVTAVSTSHRGGSIRKAREWRSFVEKNGMTGWSKDMMSDRFFPDAVSDEIWRWFDGVQRATSPDSLLDLADLLIGSDFSNELGKIEAPALLLAPDSSPFVSTDLTADMHKLIPNSEIQVFPGARHGLACSHGVECSFALLDFLARQDLA